MQNKPVVLLSNNSILAAGLRHLLQSIDGLQFSVVPAGCDAITKLDELNPAVIVMDPADPALGEGIVTRLLGHFPKSRVVVLNLEPAGIEVYRVHQVVETNLDGLLEAIGVQPNQHQETALQRPIEAADFGIGGSMMG